MAALEVGQRGVDAAYLRQQGRRVAADQHFRAGGDLAAVGNPAVPARRANDRGMTLLVGRERLRVGLVGVLVAIGVFVGGDDG